MAEEEIEGESNEDIISRKDKRLKKLSDDVKDTNERLAVEAEARKKAEEERENASKERDFFKGFNQVASKYQNANEFQDKIWEKVKSGYDVEDATTSVLIKEGKFIPPEIRTTQESAAGGSASTSMKGGESKTPDEMSQTERRSSLLDLEARGEFRL